MLDEALCSFLSVGAEPGTIDASVTEGRPGLRVVGVPRDDLFPQRPRFGLEALGFCPLRGGHSGRHRLRLETFAELSEGFEPMRLSVDAQHEALREANLAPVDSNHHLLSAAGGRAAELAAPAQMDNIGPRRSPPPAHR